MNWFSFVIVLLVGWLIEFLIDYFYWRPRRICTDAERNLQLSLDNIQAESSSFETRIGDLKRQLNAKNTELDNLTATLAATKSKAQRADSLDGTIADLKADLDTKDAKIQTLSAKLKSLLDNIQTESSAFKAKISSLEGKLSAKNTELDTLSTTLVTTQHKAKMADTLDANINDLKTRIGTLEGQLNAKSTELDTMSATLATTRYKAEKADSLSADINNLKARISDLEGQLSAKDAKLSALSIKLGDAESKLKTGAAAGLAAVGTRVIVAKAKSSRDDLTRIWGIGPKIDKLFHNEGISTFAQLAVTNPARILRILNEAGDQFRLSQHNLHETWPEQAELAAADKWDELTEWQRRFNDLREKQND